MNKDSY